MGGKIDKILHGNFFLLTGSGKIKGVPKPQQSGKFTPEFTTMFLRSSSKEGSISNGSLKLNGLLLHKAQLSKIDLAFSKLENL